MILNDTQILDACDATTHPVVTDRLIESLEAGAVSNCTYTFHIGKIVEPDTGEVASPVTSPTALTNRTWKVGPTEIALIVTRERINLPAGIMAFYAPLNRRARQGVMLLNPSMVEPGYSGPLSCVLVNMSSQPVTIAPGDPIAKIVFLQLSAPPGNLQKVAISDDSYLRDMTDAATRYHKTFMDLQGIKESATEAATGSAKKAISFGGIIVLFLLFFAQMEPLVTKWLWERTGILPHSKLAEQTRLLKDTEANLLKADFSKQLETLRAEVKELREAQSRRPPSKQR